MNFEITMYNEKYEEADALLNQFGACKAQNVRK